MFHSRKINNIHKRDLKLVYQDSRDLTFQELLAKDKSVSVPPFVERLYNLKSNYTLRKKTRSY